MDIINTILNDIENIEHQDVMYEAIHDKLNKSLVLYANNLMEDNLMIEDNDLTDDNYYKVIRMIAKRINL